MMAYVCTNEIFFWLIMTVIFSTLFVRLIVVSKERSERMRLLELMLPIFSTIIGVGLLIYANDPISTLTLTEGFGYLFLGITALWVIYITQKYKKFVFEVENG